MHLEAVLVANPDTSALNRERALRLALGRPLQGGSGSVIDYDRGDPAHSFTGYAPPGLAPRVNAAQAAIGRSPSQALATLPDAEIYDLATNDGELTAYEQTMLARIARR